MACNEVVKAAEDWDAKMDPGPVVDQLRDALAALDWVEATTG
jgi:hypothetical protein